ncbi:MAG TPA: tryptophan 7-halogenase [Rhodanobacter sp.]|jgi:FADH2 O2-dependent halogenase|nr:tryptophan 7-halogenase [Rhodanobacter sp.]
MKKYDVAVIGSGMGGSACALVLAKLGYDVMLIERGTHPRFALGESGTPALSRKMRFISRTYGIPELDEMSTYDNIKASGNGVLCGPKELFQYFVHKKGQTAPGQFGPFPEVIVQTPEVDAQYNRAASDKHLVDIAKKYGVVYSDETSVENIDFMDDRVDLACKRGEENFPVVCDFVVDATGFNSIIGKKHDLKLQGDAVNTPLKSRCIFTHFKDIGAFDEVIRKDDAYADISPVPRSRATQHHCFDGGWIWFIPFDNGVTSVGINLDIDLYPMNDKEARAEFWEIIEQYPMVNDLLKGRETLMPFIKTGRLQFINKEIVGDRWAMLPASAYGLDAWFSTGLAATFLSVHRLAEVLHNEVLPEGKFDRKLLLDYEVAIQKEYFHIAKMVDGMYKTFKHFDIFKNYCFFCFMGTESYMEKGGAGKGMDLNHLLLSAGDEEFVKKFDSIYEKVIQYSKTESVSEEDVEALGKFIREDMKPFNFRKYGNPEMQGVHPRRVMHMSEYD